MIGSTLSDLYPFLYAGRRPDTHRGLAGSTVEKIKQAADLRASTLAACESSLARCATAMAGAFRAGGRMLALGNGGSATDAQALADLFADPPVAAPALPAFALSADAAILSALANDVGVDAVFARQVAAYARPNDIVVALSTSGDSGNVLAACAQARQRGLLTIGFAGGSGGAMAAAAAVDHLFVVDSPSVHRIQETQTTLCHVLWQHTVAQVAAGTAQVSGGR